MAKEYIEREVAKEKITEEKEFYASSMMNPTAYDIGYCNGLTMAFSLLLNTPAADVAPVRYGRWEKSEDDYCGLNLFQCSLCHEEWCFEIDDDVIDLNYHYCPNCGAKMDKEE